MPVLRSLRLLGSVEAGTTSGAQLETFLADAGRKAELSVLLASRGQSRRMANAPLTMAAIVASPEAIKIVFQAATTVTNAACTAVVASPTAMGTVSASPATLNILGANPVSWGLYKASTYYETNVRPTILNLAGLTPATYPLITDVIASSVAMAAVSNADYAVSAVVASPPTVTLLVANASAMGQMAGRTAAITLIAAETAIMGMVAGSTVAMTEINNRAGAVGIMANNVGAITAISKSTGWTAFQAGSYFAANVPAVVANLIGVSTTTYPTLNSIIDDATTMAKVAASVTAMTAMASNSAALTYLANSANLPATLGSATAMGVLGPNTSAMNSFLGVSGAWAPLFSSSIAKGYIVNSTTLVNTVAANSALITYLGTIAVVNASATGIPDGNATSLQAFVAVPALPAKLLTLSAKEAGIAATFSNYNFGGSVVTGSQGGATLNLTAAASLAHVAGYQGMTWNLQGIGVTAATLPIITYVSMV